jgi:serine/threonine-protein kinase SRPK3
MQVWDLFENQHLFKAQDVNKQDSNLHHLAEMVAVLGPPPTDFLQRSNYASDFFDSDG